MNGGPQSPGTREERLMLRALITVRDLLERVGGPTAKEAEIYDVVIHAISSVRCFGWENQDGSEDAGRSDAGAGK
jgi:hypothetical protein